MVISIFAHWGSSLSTFLIILSTPLILFLHTAVSFAQPLESLVIDTIDMSYLKNPDNSGAAFGESVSFGKFIAGESGDSLVVGAPMEWANGARSGALYHYKLEGQSYNLLQHIPGTGSNRRLGNHTFNGTRKTNLHNLVNSWHLQDGVRVFIPRRGGLPLNPTFYYQGFFDPNEWTGAAIGVGGDLDGDGFNDILIGAPRASINGAYQSGAAVVVSGKNGQILSSLPGSSALQYTGMSVAFTGDLNRDRHSEILIGVPGITLPNQPAPGAFLLLDGKAASQGIAQVLKAFPTFYTQFEGFSGYARAGKELPALTESFVDVNGDGINDIMMRFKSYTASSYDSLIVVCGASAALGIQNELWRIQKTDSLFNLRGAVMAQDYDGDGVRDFIVLETSTGLVVRSSVTGNQLASIPFDAGITLGFSQAVNASGDIAIGSGLAQKVTILSGELLRQMISSTSIEVTSR